MGKVNWHLMLFFVILTIIIILAIFNWKITQLGPQMKTQCSIYYDPKNPCPCAPAKVEYKIPGMPPKYKNFNSSDLESLNLSNDNG